ncbi:MAG: hypothetical protein FWF56_04990 [Firmicutes bacterium]|nr:hypothetical protein [Bacillota bacterium]
MKDGELIPHYALSTAGVYVIKSIVTCSYDSRNFYFNVEAYYTTTSLYPSN